MQIIDLGDRASIYRFCVVVPSHNKTPISTVNEWLNDNKIPAAVIPGRVYFREESDAILFVLKWSI